MRENNENFNKLIALKNQFSEALEVGDMRKANETLDSIDTIFYMVSGKSFRDALTPESQIKLNDFLKNDNCEEK
jgi:hypothetical protein